jgi:O-antigen ligase
MSRLTNLFAIAFVVVALFPVLTGADTYFFEMGLLPPYPSFVLLFTIFIAVLIKSLVANGGQELFGIYRNTVWITVPFGMLVVVSLVWAMHPGANWDENGRIIFMDLYHWALLMLSIGIANSKIVRKYYRLIFLIMFLGASTSILVDTVSPAFFSKLTHRAAGFYHNANQGALSIVLLATGAINWKKHDGLNLFLLILVPISIYPTLSVGSFIVFLLILTYYLVFNLKEKAKVFKKLAWVVTIVLMIFFIVMPSLTEISNTSRMLDNRTSKDRIEDIIQLGQGDLSFVKEHNRLDLVYQYLDIIADAPIMGHGTGFAYIKNSNRFHGPHNMYLKFWVEQGIFGISLYLLLLGGSFLYFMNSKDRRGMVLVFVFIYYGFLDHNLLTNRTLIVLLGIFGTFTYLEKAKHFSVGNPGRKWAFQ